MLHFDTQLTNNVFQTGKVKEYYSVDNFLSLLLICHQNYFGKVIEVTILIFFIELSH